MTLSEHAPAKVNLCLHVTGQRADGYHLLDSLVVFTQVGDSVALTQTPGLTLTGPEAAGLQSDGDNLVSRAARLTGAEGLGLVLDKHLPVASGIGGGSSDAAATLRLIARARGLPLPDAAEVLRLGADVPVCLTPRPRRMQGIGEILSDLPPVPDFALVLVNPRVCVPTPAVFRAFARLDGAQMGEPGPWPDLPAFVHWLSAQRNDLQVPACQIAPVIAEVLTHLRALPACLLARMSGSGATCFGVFATLAQAQAAADLLTARAPHWWVRPTGLLTDTPRHV
ncbi:MAG: 4-(cytidine 5'-diphospho)-2-C-methyl-D-erythritol kinase [Roseinatronobacter sp.]